MKRNLGMADRVVRIIIAAIIAGLYLSDRITGSLAYILLAVAGLLALTSLVRICPLYTLFGINTSAPAKQSK